MAKSWLHWETVRSFIAELKFSFNGETYLNVDGAHAPELINWENLRARRKERFFRAMITSGISLLLLFATCAIIWVFNYYKNLA